MLDITQTEVDRTLTVRYTGELDQHTARQTIERSEDLLVLYPCDSLVLDLSGLTFMDSSGLAVVLHLHRTCARCGCDFRVRGTPPQPQRVFDAAGLPQVIVFERGEVTLRTVSNKMSIKFESRSVNEAFARQAVGAFASQLDPTMEELGDIKTVVSEAVTNAIVHGYADRSGFITVAVRLFEGRALEIKIKDTGCGIENVEQGEKADVYHRR